MSYGEKDTVPGERTNEKKDVLSLELLEPVQNMEEKMY